MTVPEPKGARIVPRPFDSDCGIGICPHGCSHLMWRCDACGSEGGWGVRDEKLRVLAAAHVCAPGPEPVQEDPRNELGAIVASIFDRPYDCPGEHAESYSITYLVGALEQSSWLAGVRRDAAAGALETIATEQFGRAQTITEGEVQEILRLDARMYRNGNRDA